MRQINVTHAVSDESPWASEDASPGVLSDMSDSTIRPPFCPCTAQGQAETGTQ